MHKLSMSQAWMSYYTSQFYMDMIIYPCPNPDADFVEFLSVKGPQKVYTIASQLVELSNTVHNHTWRNNMCKYRKMPSSEHDCSQTTSLNKGHEEPNIIEIEKASKGCNRTEK